MIRRLISAVMLTATAVGANAQHYADPAKESLYVEEGQRLINEEYYYGSKRVSDQNDIALQLINSYFLNESNTFDGIEQWLRHHAVHPERNRLEVMRANLLVRQEAYDRALDIYDHIDPVALNNLPEKEQAEANLYGAIAYIKSGDLGKAERMLRLVQDSPSHQPDIYYYLGYIKYVRGDYDEAIRYFTAVEDSREYRSLAPVYLADSYLQKGNASKAIELSTDWQRTHSMSDPLYGEARRVEGEAQYTLRDYDNAISSLHTYLGTTDTPTRTALYKLGMSQFARKQYDEAAKMLSKSAGTATDAMAQSAWLNAGKAYITTGSKRQAGIAFQQASQMSADKAVQEEAFYNYALTLHDGATMGFGESVNAFEQFLNKYPKSQYATTVAQHLTEVYFTTKNYPAALKSINKIKNPTADIISAKQKVLYNLGTQSFANGNYKSAKNYMAQSNATLKNSEAVFWKGESEYRLGEYSAAATDYNAYLKSGKNAANKALANYGLGYINFKNKKYASALTNFRNYLSGSLSGRADLQADAYNRIGDCLYAQRQFDQANDAYNTAFATDKTHGDYSLLQMSMISGLKGDYQKKVEILSQLENTYNNSEYADNALFEQGRAYVLSGNREAAMDTYRVLTQRYPNSTNARRAMNEIGMIYQESGQTEQAVSQYTSVVERFPNTEEASAALESLKQIYNAQGKVNEYAELARKAGKALSPTELDEMTENAAVMATADGDQPKAVAFYQQLASQTLSEDTRARALENGMDCAKGTPSSDDDLYFASKILDSNVKISPNRISQARLMRAQYNMSVGNSDAAVSDYRLLAEDQATEYGAQGTVELAQYAYNTGQYDSAERILDRFIDSGTTYSYWLARAFVLLSDVYMKTGREIEAKEYLLSLKSNYTESEEINKMIEERLKL